MKENELEEREKRLLTKGKKRLLTRGTIYFSVTSNQLTIPSLARHHLLSIFTCQAINNNITVPSATSITLDLNRKLLSFSLLHFVCLIHRLSKNFILSTFSSPPLLFFIEKSLSPSHLSFSITPPHFLSHSSLESLWDPLDLKVFSHFRLFFHPSSFFVFTDTTLHSHFFLLLTNSHSQLSCSFSYTLDENAFNHGFGCWMMASLQYTHTLQWNRLKWKSVNLPKYWWRIKKQSSNVQLSDPDQRLLFIGTSMAKDLTLLSMVLYQKLSPSYFFSLFYSFCFTSFPLTLPPSQLPLPLFHPFIHRSRQLFFSPFFSPSSCFLLPSSILLFFLLFLPASFTLWFFY